MIRDAQRIPPLRFARAFCYNPPVRLRGGQNRCDAELDLFHTPGRMAARDRLHAKRLSPPMAGGNIRNLRTAKSHN